ncbi:MAG: hypothetical protein IPK12_13440 [Gemmatimonadetes bacterium]|nr:hypothetical protein [Gemmatimonadota bacterium]
MFFASLSLAKAPVALIVLVACFYWYLDRGGRLSLRLLLGGTVLVLSFPLAVLLLLSATTDVTVGKLLEAILRRLFVLPAEILYAYFEIIPVRLAFLHGRTIGRVAWLLGEPAFNLSNYVYQYMFPTRIESGAAPAAFLGFFYADFGMIGVVLGGVAAGAICQGARLPPPPAEDDPLGGGLRVHVLGVLAGEPGAVAPDAPLRRRAAGARRRVAAGCGRTVSPAGGRVGRDGGPRAMTTLRHWARLGTGLLRLVRPRLLERPAWRWRFRTGLPPADPEGLRQLLPYGGAPDWMQRFESHRARVLGWPAAERTATLAALGPSREPKRPCWRWPRMLLAGSWMCWVRGVSRSAWPQTGTSTSAVGIGFPRTGSGASITATPAVPLT